jgi:hypothetical protein
MWKSPFAHEPVTRNYWEQLTFLGNNTAPYLCFKPVLWVRDMLVRAFFLSGTFKIPTSFFAYYFLKVHLFHS